MADVIRLPTAASRQVKGNTGRKVAAYRDANPWPGDYVPPAQREALRQIAGLSPAEIVVKCLMEALPRELGEQVRNRVYELNFHAGTMPSLKAAWIAAQLAPGVRKLP